MLRPAWSQGLGPQSGHELTGTHNKVPKQGPVTQILASPAACAGVFAVLRQRRARVISEELREGSDLFSVLAHLPVQVSVPCSAAPIQ